MRIHRYHNRTRAYHKHYREYSPKQLRHLRGQVMHYGVLCGEIVRPQTCEKCGSECRVNAHHESYAPRHLLEITWLCRLCHAEADKAREKRLGIMRRKPMSIHRFGSKDYSAWHKLIRFISQVQIARLYACDNSYVSRILSGAK